MLPIRKTVRLTGGHVTLRAWPAPSGGGYLLDLLNLTVALKAMQDAREQFEHEDVEPHIWAAVDRLTRASLEQGQILPLPLSWGDYLSLLDAMFELNDIEEAEGKWNRLMERTARLLTQAHHQAPQTAP